MENYNSLSGSKETATPTLEPAKKASKESKVTSSSEVSRSNTKQKVAPDLGKTIERSLFNARTEPTAESPKVAEIKQRPEAKTPEQPSPELLNDEEILYVRQAIASNHLEAIHDQADQTTSEALQPAVDFLERVKDGQEPEQAAAEVDNELLADTEPDDSESEADENSDDADLTPPTNQPGNPQVPNTLPPAGGGTNNRPPRPPLPPTGPTPPTPPNPGNQPNPILPPRPQNSSSANILPPAANTYYANRRQRGTANTLVGGLAGYLLGRRHGRRKAEKRLLPVQQQLEQQVGRLEQSITATEQQLVASKAARLEQQQTMPLAEKRQDGPVRLNERTQPGRQETRLGMEKPRRAEHLGHVAIGSEAPQIIERTRTERPNNIRQAFRPEAVKTMHRNELLELSEKITVEGASLRRVYESRLITEKQLRHLVGEYLAGKDIRRELRRQMVEREIDFERDPQLRDRVRSHLASTGSSNGLNELLQTVGAMPEDTTKLTKQEQRQADKQLAARKKQQQQRKLADASMATAIVVLAIIVIVLLIR